MKKRSLAILLTLLLLLTTTGCSASGAARTLDEAEDRIENKLDAVEDAAENAIRKAVSPAQTAPASTQAALLTAKDAEKIALDHVGFSADQVQRLRTDYEVDDGIPQFDVEFHEGDWEYEFEIHAESGQILSFDKDHKYD